MPLPVVLAWSLGVVGAAALARVLSKEWQRVNATLHTRERAQRETIVPEKLPKLRRDPRTGVYRPD